MAGMCLTREEKKKKKKKLATETRGSGDPPLDNITARRCQRPMLEETERYRETRRETRDERKGKRGCATNGTHVVINHRMSTRIPPLEKKKVEQV